MLLYTNPFTGQSGCECGHLPYTVTLTFSGLTEGSGSCLPSNLNGQTVVLRTPSIAKKLVGIVIRDPWLPEWFFGGASGECIGLDASQYDGVPGPLPGLLPFTSFPGFAVLGRVPPPISLVTFQGTGATLTPVFEESVDFIGGLPAWKIGSVQVSGGGSGYIDGGTVTFSTAGVLRGRDGWNSLAPNAILRVRTREQPVVAATLPPPAGFDVTPATLAVSLSRNPGYPATWSVAAVEVLNGGAGYPKDQAVTFSVSSPSSRVLEASAVAHVGDGGVMQFVRVHAPGSYFRNEGRAVEVEVVEGGLYYGESRDIAPHVNPISIEVQQIAPSNGSGAEFDYTIDSNPYSATFGRITSVTLTNPGEGYTLLGGNRQLPGFPEYGSWQVECASGGFMELIITKPAQCEGDDRNLNMSLGVYGLDGWIVGPVFDFSADFQSEGPVVDAADLPEQLEGFNGTAGTVTLTPGGRYIGPRGPCCSSCPADRGNMDSVTSITVTVQLAYPPCGVNTTVTLTLNRSDPQAFWQASQDVGDMRVGASLGAFAGFYSLQADVLLCQEAGGFVPITRYFRMEAIRIENECVPVGFDDWTWLPTAEGEQYGLWLPGNELPPEFPGLAVNVSASVVFA